MNYPRMRLFNNMMLILTEGCNLRCAHCYERRGGYEDQKRMSWLTAKKAADLFLRQVPPGMERTSITFFGGEPALEFDLIKKVVGYTYNHRTLGKYAGDKYNYVINTNGTILSDDMFDFYKQLGGKLNIRVSVDGYAENHDRVRKTAGGQGSWQMLEKTLPLFRTLREDYDVKINLVATISKLTYGNIYTDYTKLYEMAGLPIGFLFVHEGNWQAEDSSEIKRQVERLHEWCIDRHLRFSLCDVRRAGNNRSGGNDAIGCICGAGVTSFTVNHDGNIYPCHRCYYYGMGETYRLGNVETGIASDLRGTVYALNRLENLPAACQTCEPALRSRCHLCFASNEKVYGDLYSVSSRYCELMKDLYHQLLERERRYEQQREAERRELAGSVMRSSAVKAEDSVRNEYDYFMAEQSSIDN